MTLQQSWSIVGLATVALFLRSFLLAGVQAYFRLKYKIFVRPEDAAYFGKTEASDEEHPLVIRAQMAIQHDLENTPFFLFLLVAYVQLKCWPMGCLIAAGVFVLARYVHALAYLRSMQPLRNRAYVVGVLVNAGLSVGICLSISL